MSLTMRRTGLGHGVYKDDIDFGVFSGEWCIGRIYDNRSGPEDMRWFWALHSPSKPGTLRISNRVATLEVAKAEFEASWKQRVAVTTKQDPRSGRVCAPGVSY
jgi:hypothetical protein